ncbi:hypothetical protein HC251_07140 [Iamia sp. SCSIO 61187]|uniref:diadenylate cyclase n=1 Tax=Iamia sp. SCSIO 61187 TaxID=2722752 RepID=UPI001C6313EF|nr:diadenylate cyclase [Iamia sp. SCSIO 61187]QYG92232.1 hypothetical protein HC251_07140 [Iamia sp. SCSIO 61187]
MPAPHVTTSRAEQRLADELEDDGVVVRGGPAMAAVVVQELDYVRRTPQFEGRHPLYGAMIVSSWTTFDPQGGVAVELVDAPHDLMEVRPFADGRASYLVRTVSGEGVAIACFEHPLQYEADLVAMQADIGGVIVQRTPVLGVTRFFQDGQVVSWDGRRWNARSTAASLLPTLLDAAPDLAPAVAHGMLDLAVHWLSPAHVGATLVVHDGDDASFDTSGASRPPALTLTNRRHFPPLLSCLVQRDLATIVDGRGTVTALGVGLLSGAEAAAISNPRGMRHRSAQRWSFDHPDAVVTVVSEDGPITAYRAGEAVIGPG